MKHLLLITLASILTIKTYGQSQLDIVNAKVATKITILKSDGIAKYMTYYTQCIGDVLEHIPDSCAAYHKEYLVWVDKGKYYKQLFDECSDHPTLETSSEIFDLLDNYPNEFKNEDMKKPQYYDVVNGKSTLLTVVVDHSCITHIKVYWENEILEKRINDFDTNTKYLKSMDGKDLLNINYKSNRDTHLYKLYTLTQKTN